MDPTANRRQVASLVKFSAKLRRLFGSWGRAEADPAGGFRVAAGAYTGPRAATVWGAYLKARKELRRDRR